MKTLGQQMQEAIRRQQDKDWDKWSPKQRKRARDNLEYYGEDRFNPPEFGK